MSRSPVLRMAGVLLVSIAAGACGSGSNGSAAAVGTPSPSRGVVVSASPIVSPADTCLTVQKLTDIAARFDPLWRKFPKDLTTTTAEVANGLAEKLAAVQDELADVPKVIANEQVTAGRPLLGQAVDLAVSGWGDLAQSIRAKDTSLEAQASGEIAQVGDAYHAFITDIFSMSACF